MVEMLQAVISTLNEIEVKGKENMTALLGSINVLEEITEAMVASVTEEKEENDGGDDN